MAPGRVAKLVTYRSLADVTARARRLMVRVETEIANVVTRTAQRNPMTNDTRDRISATLSLIQSAQADMAEATAQIGMVDGFAGEHTAVSFMHDQIKDLWHKVNNRRVTVDDTEVTKR